MNELALFAGIGGGILGSHIAGWRTVAGVEFDAFCRDRLLQRQDEGHLLPFPIWDDVRTFDGRPFRGVVDLVSAGFPCQPFSVAGKKAAHDDPRNLWPDTARILGEVRPRWALLENVPGLLAGSHGYFGQILGDLAELGYDVAWRVVSARDVGAPHRRRRLWILCSDSEGNGYLWRDPTRGVQAKPEPLGKEFTPDSDRAGCDDRPERDGGAAWPWLNGTFGDDPLRRRARGDADREGREGRHHREPGGEETPLRGGGRIPHWFPEAVAVTQRMDDGVPHRLDRVHAIGNAQVPAVVLRVLRDAELIGGEG